MKSTKVRIDGYDLKCYSLNTLIIGSGAASLNAAVSLHSLGQDDILICTENIGGGTSRNAGSDKQTYYKLSLAGSEADSFTDMARDLFNGHCMHGDIALCEAQGSVQAFMNLVRLGVPFPQNEFGAWVGYKTDHDPRSRATSAGPYTSRIMVEKLTAEVKKRKIKILDRHLVIALLTSQSGKEKKVSGALAIDIRAKKQEEAFVLFNTTNIILGTGGPAGIYGRSVYPLSQSGFTGMAFEAGATGQNLTESQFGIASVKFRWNLSGSYQQVIPRYYSTNKSGKDEREFLNDFFPDLTSLTKAIFLKGYQWPFDPSKIDNHGSSLIDLLVFRETIEKGRRVFIDFSRNPAGPCGQKFSLNKIDNTAKVYLKRSGALADTPYKRLELLNRPAIHLYLDHKINLETDPLEIAVCAQHNNGGLKGNIWWESDLKHLFPVGEVNGSHGVFRPGGSALNSGHVGSYRAAQFISRNYKREPENVEVFLDNTESQVVAKLKAASVFSARNKNLQKELLLDEIRARMDKAGGIIRDYETVKIAAKEAARMWETTGEQLSASTVKELVSCFRLSDICLTHYIYLEAIKGYMEGKGRGRGSYLITEGQVPVPGKTGKLKPESELCRYDRDIEKNILEISFRNKKIYKKLVKVRPVPEQDLWFESVWKKNLEDKLTDC